MKRDASRGLVVAAIVATLFASVATSRQSQQAEPLRFEVAAIKPSDANQPGSKTFFTPGTFHLVNTPLKQWIEMALSVSDYAVKAPAWLGAARFDLDAKTGSDAQPKSIDLNEMMRNLLIERFGFKWHEERGTTSGYDLVRGKKVLVKASDLTDPKQRGGRSSGVAAITAHNIPMVDLATALGNVLRRPVVDQTHLSGGFEIQLAWRPDDDAAVAMVKQTNPDVENLPYLFGAVEEQLGLKLQRAQVPLDVVVVDAINHQPADN